MDGLVIFVAKYLILIPAAATLYIAWKLRSQKKREYIILVVAGGLLSFVLAKIATHLYSDPRPFIKDGVKPLFHSTRDNGFPSDHTLLAAYLGFAALSYSMRWGVGLLLIALLVGWARVDAGVHHLVDVCGSFVLTGIAYLLISQAQKRYASKKPHHKAHHSKSEA